MRLRRPFLAIPAFCRFLRPALSPGGGRGYMAERTRRPGSRWPGGNPVLEESPGSRTTGRRLTAARRKPRESATESKPPFGFGQEVRVKGWGKSPPQRWQQGWHGKPRPEQDQVGGAHGPSSARAPGVSREAVSNDRPRGMAARPRKGRTEPGLQAFWSSMPGWAQRRIAWPSAWRRAAMSASEVDQEQTKR